MASTQNDYQDDLPSEILRALSENDPILSSEVFPSIKSTDVKSALDRLGSRSMITYDTIDREEAILEPEALEIAANGSHEARVFEALRQAMDGLTVAELEAAVGDRNVAKVGQGKAFKSKWISKGKDGRLVASVSCSTRDQTPRRLIIIDGLDPRYHTRRTPDYSKYTYPSRSECHQGFEETKVSQDAKGYKLQNPQGCEIRS
jgi:phenylalanyl-tRNA synthetase alpha chain